LDVITINREAQVKGFDVARFVGWISLCYEALQLCSFSFMEGYNFISGETSPFNYTFFTVVFDFFRILSLSFAAFIDILIFSFFFLTVLFAFIWKVVMKQKMHTVINIFMWDIFYIPGMRSFASVFACTYTCRYLNQPSNFKPFPFLDSFPNTACWKAWHIVWVIFAIIGILLMHPLALRFVAREKNRDDPAMRMLPRFNVIYIVAKVCLVLVLIINFQNLVSYNCNFSSNIYSWSCVTSYHLDIVVFVHYSCILSAVFGFWVDGEQYTFSVALF
jgi:hypothetical protein